MSAAALFHAKSNVLHRTLGSVLASGAIFQLEDGRVGVLQGLNPPANGERGAFETRGIFKMLSATGTLFSAGDYVFWNTATSLAVPASNAINGDTFYFLGQADKAKISGDLSVNVDLNMGWQRLRPFAWEFVTTTDATLRTLIPAYMNPSGLRVWSITAKVTEVFAGGTEDQGVVTVKYGSTTLGVLTPTNAGADAVGDVIQATAPAAAVLSATGVATVDVPAGNAVKAVVSQATSGSAAAGKMIPYILVTPLA